MTVSRDQNAGRIHSTKMDNSSIERVQQVKYLGTTLTNQNSINPLKAKLNPICHLLALLGADHILHISRIRVKEEIKCRWKLWISSYYSVQNLLSSSLLSKTLKIKIYRTIILPVFLYGCETWSLTLREERRLRLFENRVLRRAFGPKRDELIGEWRKLNNEELRDLYSLPNIVRVVKSGRMRWAGHVARMGEGRGVQRVLVGKPDGKRPLGRSRRRWEDNIKMDLQEVEGVETVWSWLRIETGGGHL